MSTPMRFTIRQLQYFVAVVEAGSMSAAAKTCLVSQSTISLSISELERALETQLFLRAGGSKLLTLTDAGKQILGDVRRVLDQLDELQLTAHSLGQGLAGRLSIGCYRTLTPYILPRILQVFTAQYPAIELVWSEDSIVGLHEQLLHGECEVAVTYRMGDLAPFDVHRLYTLRPHILLPSTHRLAGESVIRLAELEDEPFIMLDMPPSVSLFTRHFEEAGVVPRVAMTTTSPESVRALVAGGRGYSMLLNRAALPVAYDGDSYTVAEIEERITGVDVVALTPADAHLTQRARAFLVSCQQATAGTGVPGTTRYQ